MRPVADQSIQFRPRSAAPPAVAGGGAKTLLAVQGMTCGNCARHVTEALQSVPGGAFAAVDLNQGRATVQDRKSTRLNSSH